MKSFKEYVTMNEAKDNFLTPAEIKKLKAHYDGNPGLRSISQSIKDFESDHEAFVKLKGNVDKSVKDNMIKTSTRLRKLGIEDGALTEDSDVEDKDEVELDEEDFSQIKPLIDKDIKQIRDNLFEDSKTISKVWRTFNAYPGDVDPRVLKSLKEVEQLMDKARQILTKI